MFLSHLEQIDFPFACSTYWNDDGVSDDKDYNNDDDYFSCDAAAAAADDAFTWD
jgi:hypothetical protein